MGPRTPLNFYNMLLLNSCTLYIAYSLKKYKRKRKQSIQIE